MLKFLLETIIREENSLGLNDCSRDGGRGGTVEAEWPYNIRRLVCSTTRSLSGDESGGGSFIGAGRRSLLPPSGTFTNSCHVLCPLCQEINTRYQQIGSAMNSSAAR